VHLVVGLGHEAGVAVVAGVELRGDAPHAGGEGHDVVVGDGGLYRGGSGGRHAARVPPYGFTG
jgi:hypothetical protein